MATKGHEMKDNAIANEATLTAQAQAIVQQLEQKLELSRKLLIAAVDGIFDGCGNSYVCSWTETWLRHARDLGAYNGECIGTIRRLQEAREKWIQEDEVTRFPDLPEHPEHT